MPCHNNLWSPCELHFASTCYRVEHLRTFSAYSVADSFRRLSPPSVTAGRPRYSLVWKLVMLPKAAPHKPCVTGYTGDTGDARLDTSTRSEILRSQITGSLSTSSGPGGAVCLSRPEWGEPIYLGSARRMQELVKATGKRNGTGNRGR